MLSFLEGGGAAAEAIRSHDWSTSPIGPPERWPSVLKTTVSLILASRFPQCIVWGSTLVTIPNDAFLPILGGKPLALGRPFDEVWSEVWSSLKPVVAAAFAGEATYIEDWPLTIDRHGYSELAHFTFCYSPIRDETGQIVGMLDTVTETSSKVKMHERQRLLSGELGHRLKNLLSVVQAVSSQTLRGAPDLQEADRRLTHRLGAIGRASDVLTASNWAAADLHDLIGAAIASHAGIGDRFRVCGPATRFPAEIALALGLAFHELATNAIKYGALSNDTGIVDVRWSIDDASREDARFILDWQEAGGPPVHPPTRRGFGSVMIERLLRAYINGDATVHYAPDGLVVRIEAPLPKTEAQIEAIA